VCRDHVAAMAKQIDPQQLRHDYKTELYIIGNGPSKAIPPFAKDAGYPYTIYTDPTMDLYRVLGLKYAKSFADFKAPNESRNVQTGTLSGLVWSIGTYVMSGFDTGDYHIMGGEFIFGPGHRCHFAHRQENPHDMTPIEELMAHVKTAAGNAPAPADRPGGDDGDDGGGGGDSLAGGGGIPPLVC